MEWTECISKAINYIEDNITENISIEDISKHVIISPFYFQKGFAMLCGFTVGSYIKKRRLTLAGSELVSSDKNIIDIAFKYGYDSPDSFTKAFTRFHGVTPTSVRNGEIMIKSFAPLKIKFVLNGGYIMDYKIVEKDEFTIIGVSKVFKYNDAEREVPKFWKDFYESGKSKVITSMYGISIDENMNGDEFEYLIADNYNPIDDIQDGFVTKIIPKSTWAIFACKGTGNNSIKEIHKKIFSEWLPNCRNYEISAGYNIEMYNNPDDYVNGIDDDEYYSEIWIPVKRI